MTLRSVAETFRQRGFDTNKPGQAFGAVHRTA
jgi:hypothetical protein